MLNETNPCRFATIQCTYILHYSKYTIATIIIMIASKCQKTLKRRCLLLCHAPRSWLYDNDLPECQGPEYNQSLFLIKYAGKLFRKKHLNEGHTSGRFPRPNTHHFCRRLPTKPALEVDRWNSMLQKNIALPF